ncbi:TPA: signal recognition particle protein [Candidatus Marinimicrobia bacterium]|nr:MAG: Signal recognition particle protein [Marinimicrobia bacterium 46_47]KUK89253.1 MAG: signal recognition particle protein [Marinimicrobia bacterium 46_43]HAE87329.1 signal recognition particle protein [Candidatus Neomarinimicrobiota bacterium]HBY19020.1 signal recognition particle protein [Candidatus Neomarinimicrobiota bacterium]
MLEQLRENLDGVLKKLRGQGTITESNIQDAMREVRQTLLEADVNFTVARDFITAVTEKALGVRVLKSVTPGQQIIKIIHEELTRILGDEYVPLNLGGLPPAVLMLVGLQGSGKTTLAAKLGVHLKSSGKRPLLVAADVYRPAAIDQLIKLGIETDIPVHAEKGVDPLTICRNAMDKARQGNTNVVIVDTAGRLHIDEKMMGELRSLEGFLHPREILFVADGMIGQDAVNAAREFNEQLSVTGLVLTKMDGDTRGGAALSIKSVTGKPVKFISSGEKPEDLEPFHPGRFADRILGKGDIVSLVEKAQEAVDEKEAEKLEQKLRKNQFTLTDFQKQLNMVKKMGPLGSLMEMIPGFSRLKNVQVNENHFIRTEAILNSMTFKEREMPQVINASRRKRIARGSGTEVSDVNRLLNQFEQMKKMMKKMNKMKLPGKGFNMPGGQF